MQQKTMKEDIGMQDLLSLWLTKLVLNFRRYQNKHALQRTYRDIDYVKRSLAEHHDVLRELSLDVINLKHQRNELNQ